MNKALKHIWKSKLVREWISTTAVFTVLITIVGLLLWGIWQAFAVIFIATGLIWVLLAWVVGSFIYTIVIAYKDFRRYQSDPENYGFWNDEVEEKTDEPDSV